MNNIVATRHSVGYDISDVDSEGIGALICSISARNDATAAVGARILVLARNLPGGWERAIEILRAEIARTS